MSQPTTRCDVSPPVPPTGYFDLSCAGAEGRDVFDSALRDVQAIARKWCQDRALPAATVMTVTSLLSESVGCGPRVRPRGLTLTIRWVGLDHLRLELVWLDCRAGVSAVHEQAEAASAAFDALADGWGVAVVGVADAWQWFDVDTRAGVSA